MSLTLNPIPRDGGNASGDLYRYVGPMVESWLAVPGKGIALTNTTVSDPNKYAGDFNNAGTGALALRATAGSHVFQVLGTGIAATDLAVSGALTIGGNLSVTGTLGVTGHTTLSTLTTSGAVTIQSGGLTVTSGGISVAANGITITAGGLTVNAGGASITGTVAVTGAVTVSTTLGVTGASTLGALSAGASTLSSLVVSTGQTISAGGLTITAGGLIVSAGGASITGTVAVTGAVTVSTTLGVTGTSTLGVVNAGATSVTTLGASGASTLAAVTCTTLTASSTVQGTQLISTVSTGTAPLTVSSNTVVTNLNASLLQGNAASAFSLAGHAHAAAYVDVGGDTMTGNLTVSSGGITITGNSTFNNTLTVAGNFNLSSAGAALGFFGSAPNTKQTVTGSRGGNAALQSLLSALANYGLVVDSSS